MDHKIANFIWACVLVVGVSCQKGPSSASDNQASSDVPETKIVKVFHGNLPSAEYDSIVNQLTLYDNETFDLHQVDRIAEHHLNEKDHEGIYVYLADSTQLGLYSMDGYLMLQFSITDSGLVPLILETNKVLDPSIIWKIQ